MSFSLLDWNILISSFKKISWPSSNFPPWKTFEVWSCKNIENTLKVWKIHWKYLESQYCFANISSRKARIFRKIFMVVHYYFVSLSFKFHEHPLTKWRARVVNVCTRDKTCACANTTCGRAFIAKSLWNFERKLTR